MCEKSSRHGGDAILTGTWLAPNGGQSSLWCIQTVSVQMRFMACPVADSQGQGLGLLLTSFIAPSLFQGFEVRQHGS
jgi:hypothetical protein